MGRIENIQYLRAIAALIVVASHAVADVGRASGTPPNLWWPGPFGVEIFFVVSGFIIARTTRGPVGMEAAGRFAWNRMWRVVPLYWLCTTVYLALALAVPGLINRDAPDLAHIAASYLFIPYQGASPIYGLGWSLNYEMFFYACFSLAMFAPWGRTALVLAFVLFAATGPLYGEDTALGFLSQPYLFEFLIGIGLAQVSERVPLRLPSQFFWPTLVSLLAASAWAFTFQTPQGPTWWSIALASLMVALAVFTLPAADIKGVMNLIGDASFSLYLLHMFVIRGIAAISAPSIPAPFLWLLVVCMSIAVSVISYRWFERPLANYARACLPGRLRTGATLRVSGAQ